MIDAPNLLKDLQRLLPALEDDLRERAGAPDQTGADTDAELRAQYQQARDAGRVAAAFEVWRDEIVTQAAVAWVLGCVFVRFLEDNALIPSPLLSGPGERRARALDERELWFRAPERRTLSDREYLLHAFDSVRAHPAAADLLDPAHNPLWRLQPSADAAAGLLRFFQRVDPDSGALLHDFTDPDWNTRFLGDLYQDLSEAARKRYALLQTPDFVEEFILERTLTPAIDSFGLGQVRLIDPTCGSGHFLLGAFERLFAAWQDREPGTNPRELARRALAQVHGVDLNPFAVAIARFRLLIAALRASGIASIRREQAPAFQVNVAAGDSLLHGPRAGELDLGSGAGQLAGRPGIGHAFAAEDLDALDAILGRRYHAVVGNPPYVTVKDKAV
ncbi:BREX-2 system adenine-specific DNA-methyltransferase PglX, partial [Thiohalocapsa halophila]